LGDGAYSELPGFALIGEKAGDFVRKVEKSLSSTPGL
jgi:hypothetical protein